MFQSDENRFISLFLKVKQHKAIQLPQVFLTCYQYVFAISLYSWFIKLIRLCGEYVSMLFLTHQKSDLNLLSSFNRSRHLRSSIKNAFLNILQYSQESSCGSVSFSFFHVFRPEILSEKNSSSGVFQFYHYYAAITESH